MAAEAETLERASKYLERAVVLRANFEEAANKGEFDKASEMLWGIFSCYVNTLSLLKTGKTLPKHGLMVEFAEEFAKANKDPRLVQATRRAEFAHANFYHGFIHDKNDLAPIYEDIVYASKIFDAEVRLLLKEHQRAGETRV